MLRLIDAFQGVGLFVGSVCITMYTAAPEVEAFEKRLNSLGIRTFRHYKIPGYPNDVARIVSDEGYGRNDYIETSRPLVVVTAPGPGSGKMATCLSQVYHEFQRGVKAGVALNPATPVCVLESIIDVVDMVLLMSVNPGFGGQSFIPGTIAKLHELKAMCERHGVSPLIEVDGGISSKNIAEVVKAGANALVAGSAVFKSEDPTAEVALLQKLGNEAAQEA